MKCSTPGRYIKAFGRAVYCLSKIGEDIYFEGESNGLAVRTVSQSRSAYGSFLFHTSFFSKFSLQTQNSGELRCKVSSRSCLSIFKSLATLEKTVDTFSIELKYTEGELIFVHRLKTGVKKQYVLAFQECEGLNAIFDKTNNFVQLATNSKFLSECVVHFPSNVSEVVLSVTPTHALMKNYVEETEQAGKVLQTEIKMLPSEFGRFTVPGDKEVTFCLRELKAIISYQDTLGVPLNLHFDDPGRPVIISMDGDGQWECDFVLATISDSNLDTSTQNSSQAVRRVESIRQQTHPPKHTTQEHLPTQKSPSKHDNPTVATPISISPPVSPPEVKMIDFSPVPPSPPPEEEEYDYSPPPPSNPRTNSLDLVAPPSKRFKRLSSDDESDTEMHIAPTANIMYCDESD